MAFDVRQLAAQHDERQALHEVGDHGTEHGHVQQRADDLSRECVLTLAEEVDDQREDVPDDRAGDQRDVWRVSGRVGDRKTLGEIPCARQRVGVATIGVDDREETGDQPDQPDQRQHRRRGALPEDRLEAVEQRGRRRSDLRGSAADPRVQEQGENSEQDQGGEPPDGRTGDVFLRIVRLLRGQWQFLDRQIEPDREG